MPQKALTKGAKKVQKGKSIGAERKVAGVTKKGGMYIPPKKAALKEALKDSKAVTSLINKKNEYTAAAHASTDGGRLNVVKAAEGFELNKKGKLIEATKNLPAKKTA